MILSPTPYYYSNHPRTHRIIIIIISQRRLILALSILLFVSLFATTETAQIVSGASSSSSSLFVVSLSTSSTTTRRKHDRLGSTLICNDIHRIICGTLSSSSSSLPSSLPPASTTIRITNNSVPPFSTVLLLNNNANNNWEGDKSNGFHHTINNSNSIEEKKKKNEGWESSFEDNNTQDRILFDDLPRHIAFICDGNSRWSEQQQQEQQQQQSALLHLPRGLSSSLLVPPFMRGHAAGADRVVRLIDTLVSMRQKNHHDNYPASILQYCTLFAFSTENWSRPYHEVAGIFQLLEKMAIHYSKHDVALREGKVQIRILGNLDDERIPTSTRNELRNLEVKSKVVCDERRRKRGRGRRKGSDATDTVSATATATAGSDVRSDNGSESPCNDHDIDEDHDDILTICLAINYGGRADILHAATELARSIIDESSSTTTSSSSSNAATVKAINEMDISKRLCTSSLPDVDLIVRTGGERRLSNFFLWEGAYAELYFTDVLWPDFDEKELEKALVWYGKRNRRFGGR